MVKGYKVFNKDWTCRGFQYEVGKTYEMNDTPRCCVKGFHFCKKAIDCFDYYSFDPNNKVAEVVALGEIDTEENKSCTNKIQIIREIPWSEVLELVNSGVINSGKGNSGHYNSGHCNSGDRNSGNSNSGNINSGNRNSGHCNSGDRNSGHCNSGDRNSGDNNSGNRNSGDRNSGNSNSGNINSGNRNSGDRNSGHCNSGDRNSGHCNSGDSNSGNRNSGNRNSGDRNSGDRNSGHYNSGDWNKSNCNTGCFNTKKSHITFFNKPTNITIEEWRNSKAYHILNVMPQEFLKWVESESMSDEEKETHPEYETTGGYLKKIDKTQKRQEWWNDLSGTEKEIIKAIPNFDAAIFYEITGINVE